MITFVKFLTWFASPIGILTACCMAAGILLLISKAPKARFLLAFDLAIKELPGQLAGY